ncbi:hypothetical protein Scep_007653 [Stephania cephalantha]|uniref:Methyltransferase-like protein 22 n=1 Tax=Stephania cephalantha TaxID=152367 RepID=A0AAP0KAA5_9MAGN
MKTRLPMEREKPLAMECESSSSEQQTLTNPSSSDGADESNHQVMSEIHLGCPPFSSALHISRFTFPCPPVSDVERSRCDGGEIGQNIDLDEDGDLALTRKGRPSSNVRLKIQHKITSSIPRVGLQVWKAELVLADFVLHKMFTSSDFDGVVALELGAGTGLLGIILAHVAKTVFLTDHGYEVLDNCYTNVHLNSQIFGDHQASVYARELDWNNQWPPVPGSSQLSHEERYKFSWSEEEIDEAMGASILLAADVIYSDDLTDALFNTLQSLMSQGFPKVLYLALEKRYNFSLDDLDVVANGYSHFRSYLKNEEELRQLGIRPLRCFVGKRIDYASIPQYIREYNRGNEVEIWQIKYISETN